MNDESLQDSHGRKHEGGKTHYNIYKGVVNVCSYVDIKLFICRNIFSENEKIVIIFLILEKFFFKNRN